MNKEKEYFESHIQRNDEKIKELEEKLSAYKQLNEIYKEMLRSIKEC